MEYPRDAYVQELLNRRGNGLIKVLTGVRWSGKTYLLFKLFKDALLMKGTKDENILEIRLNCLFDSRYRNPDKFLAFLREKTGNGEKHTVLIDEAYLFERFDELIPALLKMPDLDVYMTGIEHQPLLEGMDEIRVRSLSFVEFLPFYKGPKEKALRDYLMYGGLPRVIMAEDFSDKTHEADQVTKTMLLVDVDKRHGIKYQFEAENVLRLLSFKVGHCLSMREARRIYKKGFEMDVTDKAMRRYVDYFIEAFLIEEAKRYDIKGNRPMASPSKFYFEDTGVMNSTFGFFYDDWPVMAENAIYQELRRQGYEVYVGVLEHFGLKPDGTREHRNLEVDFVAIKGEKKRYVQLVAAKKRSKTFERKRKALASIRDQNPKTIVMMDPLKPRYDEDGILCLGLWEFLMDPEGLAI